ncbi:MAG: MFS transporter [Anaerolineae bacterium]|nr:MFS transporter [Anaerolineae bacterium]
MKRVQSVSGQLPSRWATPFFTIWGGQALAMITSELIQFALIWWLTESSGSATVVGIATMTALLPRALLSPFLGALVDRWSRRGVLLASHAVIILSLIGLGYLFRADAASIGVVYLIIFVRACSKSFQMPAMLASTSLMVPGKHLARVAGLNQMVQGIMLVVAPPLGAVLVHTLPVHAIVAVDIAGTLAAVVVLLLVSIPNPPRVAGAAAGWRSLWEDVCAGVRYVRNWRGAPEMLSISATINFLSSPAFMLTSILITRCFGGAEREFGLIGAAVGVGTVCGGMALSVWGGFRRPMQTSLVGIVGMAIAILVTGLTPASAFWLAAGSMFVGGFMTPVCMAPIQALVQKTVEPTIQGRVLALFDGISTTISPLSVVIAGPLFDRLGPQAWYVGAGALALLVGGVGFAMPRVLNLGEPQSAADGGALTRMLLTTQSRAEQGDDRRLD